MADANQRMPGDPGYDPSTEAYHPSDPQWNQPANSADSPNNTNVTPTANQAIYGPTGNPAGTPSGGGGGSSSSNSTSSGTYTNPAANNQLLQAAQQAAYQAYLNAKLNLDTEDLAFRKAQDAFSQTISAAQLTGTYQGQQTQAAQKQAADIAAQVAGLTGVYTPPGTPATVGGAQVAAGWNAGGNAGAAGAWNGAPDAGGYVVGQNGTILNAAGGDTGVPAPMGLPPGTRGASIGALANATQAPAGAGVAAGGGTPTLAAQQQQATLSGVYNGAPTEAARQANNQTALGYLNLIGNLKGPADYGQYLRTLGSTPGGLRDLVSSAAGQYTPASGATTGVAPQAASLGTLVNAAGTGTSGGNTYQDYVNQTTGLPAPNQISPASWNAYTKSQKDLLLGAYQNQGWLPQDVQDLYNQSLPKYAYSSGTTGTVKL